MTQAKLEYRTHVPYDVIAIKYCNLYFTGDRSTEHKDAWHDIEFSDYRVYKKQLKPIEYRIEFLNSKRLPWWRLKEALGVRKEIDDLSGKVRTIKKKMFKSEYTLVREAHKYLIDNGFEQYHEYTKGRNTTATVELWRKSNE